MLTEMNANIYDDNERIIGTWYGKPLYRKLFHATTHTVADAGKAIVDLNPLYVDEVCMLTFRIGPNTGNAFDYPSYGGNSNYLLCYFSQDKHIYSIVKHPNMYGVPLLLIVEYTKTTDTL